MAGGTPGGTVVTTPPGSTAEALSDCQGAHDMSEHKTLLQFLLDLLNNKDALADFQRDPQGALHAAGLQNVCVDDIKDLMPVVLEKVDPQKCAQYEEDCDSGRDHDDAPRHHGDHHHGQRHDDGHGDHDDHKWSDHDNEIDKVVTHLNYVTNNYSFDSHDTIYNTNNITKIWADHGADVSVNNETHNVGAGGVDVEGDNNGTVATGGHNQIGNGNEQSGDGSTTSFGNGSALSHVGTGDGGAINTGTGSATGDSEHVNSQAFGSGNVTTATHGNAATTTADSHNNTDSNNSTDSHDVTKTSTDSHDNTNSNNHGSFDTDNSSHLDSSHSGNTFSATDDSQHLNVHDNSVDLTAIHH
ncbi:MAG TPA: IniB N-terminal domain-containing protein [Actinomycetospora sp.]|jgi:hypothetical protein|uniref:IniB N-terminal domain-containing protein n=1 Tax=Actinomycetospora sp. TaxID=1872135 RepID=UPI002F405D97